MPSEPNKKVEQAVLLLYEAAREFKQAPNAPLIGALKQLDEVVTRLAQLQKELEKVQL